jgi:malonate-semialdehyde dehydrogenase (acetylating)/methylmalonate-semialdehyde dehydrogenase
VSTEVIKNYIGGKWLPSTAKETLPVHNPATNEIIAQVPLSNAKDVDKAAQAALNAFSEWRQTPPPDRIQYLFKLKDVLEDNFEDISRMITEENGKTLNESRGEMRRAIENVEVACGIPTLMQGNFLEDIARGVDEYMIRQPVGVAAIICPFNFPGMIPFWFMPYALATGNTCIVKPSERTPLQMPSTRFWITHLSGRLVLWDQRLWQNTSTLAPRPTENAFKRRAGRRTH